MGDNADSVTLKNTLVEVLKTAESEHQNVATNADKLEKITKEADAVCKIVKDLADNKNYDPTDLDKVTDAHKNAVTTAVTTIKAELKNKPSGVVDKSKDAITAIKVYLELDADADDKEAKKISADTECGKADLTDVKFVWEEIVAKDV